MPSTFNRNCNNCKKYYIGYGKKFCSRPCILLPKRPKQVKNKVYKSKKGSNATNWKGGKSVNYQRKLLAEQASREKPNQCEICNCNDRRICLDHNHKTGKFRGWICTNCNFAIGFVRENKETLIKIIKYLEMTEAKE